ncbi:MAG: sensor domain-containing diguanylate cyclase [Desulfuromonadales bacterium]|nr:sensor domain-containing diguanylate cyclase [Desulfuromonadales bacterium]
MTTDPQLLITLERRNRELEVLIEIGKALTSTLDLEGVLKLIMDQLSRLLKAQAWSLLLRDNESGELAFEIAVSPAADRLKGLRLTRGQGIAGWVAENGKPLLIPDVRIDARFSDKIDRASAFVTRSVVCVPIKSRDCVLGVIELVNGPGEGIFTHADLQILSTIADYAAIAIENARNFKRISELVITDDLTGLYNGRHLHALIEEEIERVHRFGGKLSLIFIDLDFFKKINDSRGHLVGSRTLAEIGQMIRGNIRKICKAARYGGDEFVIVLPNTGKSGAMTLATKLRELFREHEFRDEDGSPFNLTASFGLATYPDDAHSKDDLIRLADQAMYRVKETTRDAVESA